MLENEVHVDNLNNAERSDRPYSIDAALALEASLEDDDDNDEVSLKSSKRPVSMDTQVLQSLIKSLRESLNKTEAERDVALAQAKEAQDTLSIERNGFAETTQTLTARCARLEDDTVTLKLKSDADDHAISVLRSKVEESRRGLMRLQSENRRASHQTPPVTGIAALVGSTSKRDKRASFTPLTGSNTALANSHRRVSSVFDSNLLLDRDPILDNSATTGFDAEAVSVIPMNGSTTTSRRLSIMTGAHISSVPDTTEAASNLADIMKLRTELQAAKDALQFTQHELSESKEAREASEECVKALRAYISEAKVGEASQGTESVHLKLPPFPSMLNAEESDSSQKTPANPASTWGGAFGKLWKVDTSSVKPPAANSVSNSTSSSPKIIYKPGASASSPPPLTKKLGSFWSSRASISSVSSNTSDSVKPSPSLSVPIHPTMESDTSSINDSIIEPVSPSDTTPVDTRLSTSIKSSMNASTIPEEHFKLDMPGKDIILEPSLSRTIPI